MRSTTPVTESLFNLRARERELCVQALAATRGVVDDAAELLGLSRRDLLQRIMLHRITCSCFEARASQLKPIDSGRKNFRRSRLASSTARSAQRMQA